MPPVPGGPGRQGGDRLERTEGCSRCYEPRCNWSLLPWVPQVSTQEPVCLLQRLLQQPRCSRLLAWSMSCWSWLDWWVFHRESVYARSHPPLPEHALSHQHPSLSWHGGEASPPRARRQPPLLHHHHQGWLLLLVAAVVVVVVVGECFLWPACRLLHSSSPRLHYGSWSPPWSPLHSGSWSPPWSPFSGTFEPSCSPLCLSLPEEPP